MVLSSVFREVPSLHQQVVDMHSTYEHAAAFCNHWKQACLASMCSSGRSKKWVVTCQNMLRCLLATAEMEPRPVALRRAHALPNDAVMAGVQDELADAADAVHQ
jgi:hypothetical protein